MLVVESINLNDSKVNDSLEPQQTFILYLGFNSKLNIPLESQIKSGPVEISCEQTKIISRF